MTAERYEGLTAEDLALVAELVAPDPASRVFGMTPAGTKRFLALMPLTARAPDSVRAKAGRVSKLLMYGFLEYQFYTAACDECITLSELALVCAAGTIERGERVPYLSDLLKAAREQGLIPPRITDQQLKALRELRNDLAHPRECHLLTPAIAFETYVVTMDLVNSLFDEEWRGSEPEPVRRMRQRYENLSKSAGRVRGTE